MCRRAKQHGLMHNTGENTQGRAAEGEEGVQERLCVRRVRGHA